MRLKKIIGTLGLITIMGGITLPIIGCSNGNTSSASSAPVAKNTLYLHSNFVDSQILSSNHKYHLFIIDETTGNVLINDEAFSCDQLREIKGCQISLPKYEDNKDDLILIISDGVSLIAATTVSKSFLPLGLNHIHFNEETTGAYIYDNLFNAYALLGNDHEVRNSMYKSFNLNPDDHNDDISFNIMLYKLYNDYQKIYGENTFYFMLDSFDKNDMDFNADLMSDSSSDNLPNTDISRANNGFSTAALVAPTLDKLIPGGCLAIETKDNSYVCKQAGGKLSSYDKSTIDNKIVQMKQVDEEYKKIWDSNLTPTERTAQEKELISKRNKEMEGLIKDFSPGVKATASALKSAAGIKVSKDTQDTIKTLQGVINIVGMVGNAWLPGVSSAMAGLANGVLDGLFIENERAIHANPNAAVEALLEQVSNKLDIVNNSVLLTNSQLNNMQNTSAAEDINQNRVKIQGVTDKLNTYFSDMSLYAEKRGDSYLEPDKYLPQYLNSNESAAQSALEVFSDKDNKYSDLRTWLSVIANEEDPRGSKLTTYLGSYQKLLTEDLRVAQGAIFSPSRNRIKIVQEYNLHVFKYGTDLISLINGVNTFYRTAAYLKYNVPGFEKINLGVYNSLYYDNSIALLDKMVKAKSAFVANSIRGQIDMNVQQIQNEYLYKFSESLQEKFLKVDDGRSACEAKYWDGKTFMGVCGTVSFVIPDLFKCAQDVREVGNKISCPVLSFANSEMFEEGTAGKGRAKALANMIKMKTYNDNAASTVTDAAYIAAEWSYGKQGTKYTNLYASLNPSIDSKEGAPVFMNNDSQKECFDGTDDFYSTNAQAKKLGFGKYARIGFYDPSMFTYLYINKIRDTKGSPCPKGAEGAKWWADGKLVDWSSHEVNQGNSVHRTYVDIVDLVTDKKFLIPMITTYTPGGFFSSREYQYHSTLGCTASDCIVFDSGSNGDHNKDEEKQRPAVIGWLNNDLELDSTIYILGLQGKNAMGDGKYYGTYALKVDKVIDVRHPIAVPSKAGIFTISKSDIDFYTNKGSLTPYGDWLTRCNGRQFINGMAVSAATCNGAGNKVNKIVTTLDWANSCVVGSPIDVNNNGELVCRYPRSN